MIVKERKQGRASSPLVPSSSPEGLPAPQPQLSQSLFDFDYDSDYDNGQTSADGCYLYNEGKLSVL